MLQLHYCNGGVLVFDADVWAILRRTHRILGSLIGTTQTLEALPLQLLPEEVLLLLDKGLAKVVDRQLQWTTESKQKYEQFESDLLTQQQILYKQQRRKQLESMIVEIVAAKRKRGDNRSLETIFEAELERSCSVTKENMIWPILMESFCASTSVEISRDLILSTTSPVKYAVYRDLWEKGYHITTGHKFGGDFLIYLGDPVAYHAIFIVHCIKDSNRTIRPAEIVAFGRLANSVKKRAVLATVTEENKVSYITISWLGS